jgi:hypothetical protein
MLGKVLKSKSDPVVTWPGFHGLLEIDVWKQPDGFVDVGSTRPLGQRVMSKRIYIRPCYTALALRVRKSLEADNITVVSGSPGIGKSLFGLLFMADMVRAMRDSETQSLPLKGPLSGINCVLYEHRATEKDLAVTYHVNVKSGTITKIPTASASDLVACSTTLLIKDGACQWYDTECPVLWILSPRFEGLRKLRMLSDVRMLYVPPMEAEELVQCVAKGCAPPDLFKIANSAEADSVEVRKTMIDAAGHVGNGMDTTDTATQEAIIRRWAADLGPFARLVFNPKIGYGDVAGALHSLREVSSFMKLSQIALGKLGEGDDFTHSHRLVTVSPSADFTTFALTPASKRIALKFFEFELKHTMDFVDSWLGVLTGARLGLAFEPIAHKILSGGVNNLEMRTLNIDGRSEVMELNLGQMQTKEISNSVITNCEAVLNRGGVYYTPEDPSFPVIDAWTKDYFFQMTVSKDHPLKSGSRVFNALKSRGLAPKGIVFVVPETLYAEYKRQPYLLANGNPRPVGKDGQPTSGWNLPQFVVGLGFKKTEGGGGGGGGPASNPPLG